MHLLQIVHRYWPYRGGSEQYYQEMAERLAARGHRVTVLTTDAWDIEHLFRPGRRRIEVLRESHNGVAIRRFRVRRFPVDHVIVMRYLSRLPSAAMKNIFRPTSGLVPGLYGHLLTRRFSDVDIVHASPLPHNTLLYAGRLIARRRRIPLVVTPFIHTGEPFGGRAAGEYGRPHQIALLRKAALVFVQTDAERAFLAARGIGDDSISTLGMGVDPEEIAGGDGGRFRAAHGIPPEIPVVLHVGAPQLDKGSVHVVEAARLLLSRGDDLRVVMAGVCGTAFKRYLSLQEERIRGRIILTDFVQGREKKDMFHACTVMALPSRVESFGIAYLEAWLAGKPVIGAFAGGAPHVIADGEDGCLVPFADSHMLAEYVALLARNPSLAREMGERGKRKVLGEATWERRFERFEAALSRLLGERTPRG
ncbi:MAG: glycosyltransferase family 4 protein [bacterium]|nr:glycosyltransferase family 4 protein [bacterium]